MKPRSIIPGTIALLGLLLLTAPASAQDTGIRHFFEGILQVRYQTVDEVQFIQLSVKRERIRIDAAIAEAGGTFFLIDYAAKKRFIVLPYREQFIELPNPDVREDPRLLKDPVNFEKTESTEEIAGFPCDQLRVKTDQGELEIWATTKFGTPGTLRTTIAAMLAESSPWGKELISYGYFPLKVILDDGSGDQRVVFEATAIEKKALSESRFLVPPVYERTTVEELVKKTAPKKKGK